MNEINYASILDNIVAHGDGYLCLVLIAWVARRQFQFEHYCHAKFAEIDARFVAIENRLDRIEAAIAKIFDIVKDIQYELKINNFKHESYEERFRRLENERAERARIQ